MGWLEHAFDAVGGARRVRAGLGIALAVGSVALGLRWLLGPAGTAPVHVLFAGEGWEVVGTQDTGPGAAAIEVPHGRFSEIMIFHGSRGEGADRPQIATVKGNGYVRLALPGGEWGTSFVMPGYWSVDRYYHNAKITHLDVAAASPLELVLRGRLVDDAANWRADDLEIVLRPPSNGTVEMDVRFQALAAREFRIDANRLLIHEGFKPVQFSSMYIDGTYHDADTAGYVDTTGRVVAATPGDRPGRFLFGDPKPLGPGRALWLENRRPGYRDTPTAYVRLAATMDPGRFTPQGFWFPTKDPNDDNVALALHDDAVQPRYDARTPIGRYEHTLGVVAPGPVPRVARLPDRVRLDLAWNFPIGGDPWPWK